MADPIAPQSSVYQMMNFHLGEIAKLFAQPKVTLIVRSRALDEPVIMTNERDPTDIINAVKQHVGVTAGGLIKVAG